MKIDVTCLVCGHRASGDAVTCECRNNGGGDRDVAWDFPLWFQHVMRSHGVILPRRYDTGSMLVIHVTVTGDDHHITATVALRWRVLTFAHGKPSVVFDDDVSDRAPVFTKQVTMTRHDGDVVVAWMTTAIDQARRVDTSDASADVMAGAAAARLWWMDERTRHHVEMVQAMLRLGDGEQPHQVHAARYLGHRDDAKV